MNVCRVAVVPRLQKLYRRYKDVGLTVLALPCNDFEDQEPWDEARIEEFYRKVCLLPLVFALHSLRILCEPVGYHHHVLRHSLIIDLLCLFLLCLVAKLIEYQYFPCDLFLCFVCLSGCAGEQGDISYHW